MNDEVVGLLIKEMASSSVGSSTLRGQGVKGIVHSARESLMKTEIDRYSKVSTENDFLRLLDQDTKRIEVFSTGGS